MNTPLLIGIGGHYRAGKDTLAGLLAEQLNPCQVIGFSDPLRRALAVLDPIIEPDPVVRYGQFERLVGYTEAKEHPEVRRLLQRLGTEVGRDIIGPDCWVDIARHRQADLRGRGVNVIVTGVRFPNEAAMVRDAGGFTVWVDRPVNRRFAGHRSESALGPDDFDLVVANTGGIDDLAVRAHILVEQHT